MCFSKKHKMKDFEPQKMTPITSTPPVADSVPKVVGGAEVGQDKRAKKRRNDNLSLFQIQILPGATSHTGDEEPGAAGGM